VTVRERAVDGRRGRENQAPRPVRITDVTPKLVVDEVDDANQRNADLQHHDDLVADDGIFKSGMLADEEPNRDEHADQTAVERHAAVPNGNEINRVGKVESRVVHADHVVDDEKRPSADEYADQRVK